MPDYRILKGTELVPATLYEWAEWFKDGKNRTVRYDVLEGDVRVSTVCLGMDHWGKYFETMVFGGALDDEQERYATYDEAVAGHEAMLERVKQEGGNSGL